MTRAETAEESLALLALGEKDEAYARLEQTYAILRRYELSPRYAEPFAHWAVRWRALF